MNIKLNIPIEDVEVLEWWSLEFMKRKEKILKKRSTPVRVRLLSNQQFITTKSKKTIWPSIGAAKSALRLDFSGLDEFVPRCECHGYNYRHKITKTHFQDWREKVERDEAAFQEFIENWVEFVPCLS